MFKMQLFDPFMSFNIPLSNDSDLGCSRYPGAIVLRKNILRIRHLFLAAAVYAFRFPFKQLCDFAKYLWFNTSLIAYHEDAVIE